ncbi:MAG TPA: hypothetical protein VI670_24825 [Thermoanaerobaculia bacterium]
MRKPRLGLFGLASLLIANSALAQVVPRLLSAESSKQRAARAGGVRPLAGCTPTAISIPSTRTGTLTTSSCYDSIINAVEDIYTFTGTAGQTITVDYSSTQYETFVYFEGLVSYADGTIESSFLSSGTSRARFTYTFTQTRTYTLETESLYGPGDGPAYTGNYTLAITTGSGPTTGACTANSTTLCLNNNRFAVTAAWKTTGGQTGNGTATPITSDTGYFTFFSATNVEVVVKVLDACGLNQRYWVFAGGLTDVNVTLTVKDTKSGTTRTYTNPLGVAFQPIQDTNALPVCP